MTPERRIVLDLARTPLNDRQAISDLMVRAGELAKRVQASKARRRVKAAPRLKAAKATKAQRQENWQTVKEAVLTRSGGACELCTASGSDAHHLLSGPLRRKYEMPATVAYICRFCHNAIHDGNVFALEDAAALAARNGAPDIVLATLSRRIDKAKRQRTA